MEGQMIPMAVYFQEARRDGRKGPRIGEVLRMLVHIREAGAVAMASSVGMATFRGLTGALKALGVRGFAPVRDWERTPAA